MNALQRPQLIKRPPLIGVRGGTSKRTEQRLVSQVASQLGDPYKLAHALPTGLAKLAFKDWHLANFIAYLEDRILEILTGAELRLMVSAPPRHGKTLFLSRALPAWYLGRFPDKRVLMISYHTDYARTQGRFARNIFEMYGRDVFGLEVSKDVGSAGHWDIQGHSGGMESTGAGGPITGKGADLLIIDDLIKGREEARSMNILENHWEWLRTDVLSRIEPGGSAIMTMTRWSLYDAIGQINAMKDQAEENVEEDAYDDWEYINFPALATENDILGRAPGDALFPQRWGKERLLRRKAQLNDDYWWEALYQGRPVPQKGDIIDTAWFGKYKILPPLAEFEYIFWSVDTASKDTELADFTVLGKFGVYQGQYYLLDVIRDKLQFPQLLELSLLVIAQQPRPAFFLVEDKGSGISLIQNLLQAQVDTQVVPIDPGQEGKVLRMQAESNTIRARKVLLPEEAPWLDAFLMEARSFPRGKKDQMDMLSQALKFLRTASSGISMW